MCVLMPVQKIGEKGLRVPDFALSLVVFKWHYGSEGVNKVITESDKVDCHSASIQKQDQNTQEVGTEIDFGCLVSHNRSHRKLEQK